MGNDSSGGRSAAVRDLLAGCFAGGVARLCVAPLDVVKIRFQVMSESVEGKPGQTTAKYVPRTYRSLLHALEHIVSTEGVWALWKGNFMALGMIIPYGGIQFMCYHQFSRTFEQQLPQPYMSLCGGAYAGVIATICTYPMDLLRTRLAVQGEPRMYKNIGDAVRMIHSKEGYLGFYAGVQPTLIEIVPYIALHFTFYEGCKVLYLDRYLEREDRQFVPMEALVAGGLSGLSSKLITMPLDTVKKRMQVQGQFFTESRYRGFLDVFQKVYHREGISGLFRGTFPSIVKAFPNSAITFTLFEAAKRYLDRHD
eukprot:Plantae.Rhodophyta-Purpureofilum_apyrenoidigerum.ctg15766.p1 GENE.Plantae.Rhodophyta-Purpureofilum_apyrenoidigerum.ctg15766~~Plantae.Rhodophyta-Purpureofilum_apyrenoidigerum.ctg15766.p1  ORF type:complete len:310 (+),score=45.19 Plantae.Rhodophyta-Purpureofilum_apyrenoidigerum.ctg15766:140-1069(+)